MTTKEARKSISSRRKTTIPTLPSVYPYPDKNASGFKKRSLKIGTVFSPCFSCSYFLL
jgi:hypothetical protein